MSEANLSRRGSLRRPILSDAILRETLLSRVRRVHCAILHGVNLHRGELALGGLERQANLREADLPSSILNGANLRAADLNELNRREAILSDSEVNAAHAYSAACRSTSISQSCRRGWDSREARRPQFCRSVRRLCGVRKVQIPSFFFAGLRVLTSYEIKCPTAENGTNVKMLADVKNCDLTAKGLFSRIRFKQSWRRSLAVNYSLATSWEENKSIGSPPRIREHLLNGKSIPNWIDRFDSVARQMTKLIHGAITTNSTLSSSFCRRAHLRRDLGLEGPGMAASSQGAEGGSSRYCVRLQSTINGSNCELCVTI